MCEELSRRSAEADYAARRTTALLSATLHSNLGSLAALSLKDPAAIGFSYRVEDGRMVVTKAAQEAEEDGGRGGGATAGDGGRGERGAAPAPEQFEIPAQLRQRYVEVPCKLRLVALGALLRARLAAAPQRCKMVVFLSTTDSVEYYHSGAACVFGCKVCLTATEFATQTCAAPRGPRPCCAWGGHGGCSIRMLARPCQPALFPCWGASAEEQALAGTCWEAGAGGQTTGQSKPHSSG